MKSQLSPRVREDVSFGLRLAGFAWWVGSISGQWWPGLLLLVVGWMVAS